MSCRMFSGRAKLMVFLLMRDVVGCHNCCQGDGAMASRLIPSKFCKVTFFPDQEYFWLGLHVTQERAAGPTSADAPGQEQVFRSQSHRGPGARRPKVSVGSRSGRECQLVLGHLLKLVCQPDIGAGIHLTRLDKGQ